MMNTARLLMGRRELLRLGGGVGAAAVAAAALPRSVRAMVDSTIRGIPAGDASPAELTIDDPLVKSLALRAIDAARGAGATYADVRLTRTESQSFLDGPSRFWDDRETLAIGVRALVNGYWGFAASPVWSNEEAVVLAQEAVAQAKANATGAPRTVELGTIPAASGSWVMPVQIDPFAMPLEEKIDFLASWTRLAREYHSRITLPMATVVLARQARAVATSEGAYFTQTVYSSEGEFRFKVRHRSWQERGTARAAARGMTASGRGWEMFRDADPCAQIPRMFEDADELVHAPHKPVDLGRFDIVFAAPVVATLVDKTIGVATELDRALGYEANAGGTSYLSNPLAMLGAYKVGNPLVTVTGNRSVQGGLATVRWDDEGVTPNDMTLVRDGIAVDFQTTREQSAWLAPWYQRQNTPVRSHGCAGAASAMDITMQSPPNLALRPTETATTFADLIAGTKKGIAIYESDVHTDHQARTGTTGGETVFREIVNGKVGAVIAGGAILFNTSELWNNVTGIGGASGVEWLGCRRRKGQPEQNTQHSVSAVPMAVKELAIVDEQRKA